MYLKHANLLFTVAAAVDLVWPSAQDDDFIENYWVETLDSPEVSPVPVIVTQSVKDGSVLEARFSLTSSTITQTSFFSVMTIVIILATFCFLCITFAAVKIIRSERVYPGQKMTVRPKRKPDIQLDIQLSEAATHLVNDQIKAVKHRSGKKQTRNRHSLRQILIFVCVTLKIYPKYLDKRKELPSVDGVKTEVSDRRIETNVDTDLDSANDVDIYDMELANASAEEEDLVQVHRSYRASSTPCLSRTGSITSMDHRSLPTSRSDQMRTCSDSQLWFHTKSKLYKYGDPDKPICHLSIAYLPSRGDSKCNLEYGQEPVVCSSDADDECDDVCDIKADNVSQDTWEELECDQHTLGPTDHPDIHPSETMASSGEPHSTLVYQDECDEPECDLSMVDTADCDTSEEIYEPASDNTMEQGHISPQGDNHSPHVLPEPCSSMVAETHNNTMEQQQCPHEDNHSHHLPHEPCPSIVIIADETPTKSPLSVNDVPSCEGYPCLSTTKAILNGSPAPGYNIANHANIPEHDIPDDVTTQKHDIYNHTATPGRRAHHPHLLAPRHRLDSCGYDVATDARSCSDGSQCDSAGCSQDSLVLPQDVSDTSDDEWSLCTLFPSVENLEEDGEEAEAEVEENEVPVMAKRRLVASRSLQDKYSRGRIQEESFCVCAQPMRDDVTL